eukprot:1918441-Prymnesium_polylepis.1
MKRVAGSTSVRRSSLGVFGTWTGSDNSGSSGNTPPSARTTDVRIFLGVVLKNTLRFRVGRRTTLRERLRRSAFRIRAQLTTRACAHPIGAVSGSTSRGRLRG